jgi:signal transduction histidine kinase
MESGIAFEVTLLSLALADKINILKDEREAFQLESLAAAKENERIIQEQNVVLEVKVKERTLALNDTLDDLRSAQARLVESEKMASLGQLTAGIAHEINNPINFVTSNVSPLQRDVAMVFDAVESIENIGLSALPVAEKKQQIAAYKEDLDFDYLKTEIQQLLKGIYDGASRTAEIVKGLQVFSRLDEGDLKMANINDGIDSSIVILNNLLDKIMLVKHYGDLPLVECYPGKLNQVFLNIISNAIYATNKKYGDEPGGRIIISTSVLGNNVLISIKDNGIGMNAGTINKVFDPFFTTKDVGEGTGLGMSISYSTIKKHFGELTVASSPGNGAEFIIQLPVKQATKIQP